MAERRTDTRALAREALPEAEDAAERVARRTTLDLNRLTTGEEDDAALLGSKVSKSCSGNSNGCEIHCETLAATPGRPQ